MCILPLLKRLTLSLFYLHLQEMNPSKFFWFFFFILLNLTAFTYFGIMSINLTPAVSSFLLIKLSWSQPNSSAFSFRSKLALCSPPSSSPRGTSSVDFSLHPQASPGNGSGSTTSIPSPIPSTVLQRPSFLTSTRSFQTPICLLEPLSRPSLNTSRRPMVTNIRSLDGALSSSLDSLPSLGQLRHTRCGTSTSRSVKRKSSPGLSIG